MRSSSGMQKVLCSIIFLNKEVTNKQWQCAETTSTLHRGGASRVLKDANLSTESATKPSPGFALKVIKTSIFQIPLNPCVLIKNVVQLVNICRQMHSVLFSTQKWKKGIGFAESRSAAHLRYELHTWDVNYTPETRATTTFQGGWRPACSNWKRPVLSWDNPTELPAMGTKSCAELGKSSMRSTKMSPPTPHAFHRTSVKCLSTGTYHTLSCITENIDFCEWL